MWAAVLHALKHKEDPRARTVILIAVGGGAFGNKMNWIADAMHMAIERISQVGVGLDIKIKCRVPIDPDIQSVVSRFKNTTNN